MDLTFADFKRLSELLKPEEESSDSDDGLPKTGISRFGPGHIGTIKKESVKQPSELDIEGSGDVKVEKNIWDEKEIPEGIRYDESEDPREKPKYEIRYRQAVSAEEVFLQMGQKTPATASCEDIIIDINLPKENEKDVDLEVLNQVLELRSPKFRLSLPLPHPVNPDLTKAEWKNDLLTVTLRLKREFDFVNF